MADSVLEIVVCPSKDAGGIPAAVGERLGSTREVRVARYPPSTREEFSSWGSLWPLNYRPRGQEGPPGAVSPADCALFEAHLDAVRREDAAMRVLTGRDGMGAIIVNPRNGKASPRAAVTV